MKKRNPINEDIEMQVAERIILNENNFKFKKYYLFIAFFLGSSGLIDKSRSLVGKRRKPTENI